MANLFTGKEVCAALNERLKCEVESLKQKNINPTLVIIRVGERSDDISYERGAMKRCETIGIQVKNIVFPENVNQRELIDNINTCNQDDSIHGILLFRPLPKHINDEMVRNMISPKKDMDGITDGSLTGVFTGNKTGYPPCTAEACMEILDYYQVNLKGKKTVVIGRSLVIGKPVAMMLLDRHATVTICHTRTVDMPACCKEAEILIVAAGRAGIVDSSFVSENQIVVDVGINMDEETGKLCGDVNFDAVDSIVKAITPVPGGVGTVTTSILAKHVIKAAKLTIK